MGTPQMRANISIPSITINDVIEPVLNEPVGNQGAVSDLKRNMSAHVSTFINSANCHLRDIGKIRKFLNTDATKTIVMDFSVESLMSYEGSRKSKTMLPEW